MDSSLLEKYYKSQATFYCFLHYAIIKETYSVEITDTFFRATSAAHKNDIIYHLRQIIAEPEIPLRNELGHIAKGT